MELSYQQIFTVPPQGLTPSFIMNCLQQAAERHAAMLGVGRNFLIRQGNCVWMLARSHYSLDNTNPATSSICIETWPRGADAVQSFRGFCIYADGKNIGNAEQSWILVDMDKRRLLPTKRFPQLAQINNTEKPPAEKLQHKAFPALSVFETVKILPEDIDINHHMNNARYLLYAMRPLKTEVAHEVRIDYERECVCGEEIVLRAAEKDDLWYVDGQKADGLAAFRAVIRI